MASIAASIAEIAAPFKAFSERSGSSSPEASSVAAKAALRRRSAPFALSALLATFAADMSNSGSPCEEATALLIDLLLRRLVDEAGSLVKRDQLLGRR